MKIGILQAGHLPEPLVSRLGDYPSMYQRMLAGFGFTYQTWMVVDGEFPPSVDACDGWLITGSRHGAYEDVPFIAPLEAFIRDCFARHIPVAGICFGHQVMAQALGGKVEKFRGGWSAGHQQYTMADGSQVVLNAWHQDQVVEAPAGARTICTSDFCTYAGLAYGDTGISFQPHPEYEDGAVEELAAARRGISISESDADKALASLGGKTDAGRIGAMVAQFFRDAARAKAA